MCGRYTLLKDELKIKQRFKVDKDIEHYAPSYNIAPGQHVLAVIFDEKERRAGYMRWGLVPAWAKEARIGYKMINARSETMDEKASFKRLLLRKRCMIIADSFYEWQKTADDKIPQRIQLPNQELFAFAGLWDKWDGGHDALFTCTILTRSSNAFMRPIHHRMPVILPESQESTWLEGSFQGKSEVRAFVEQLEPATLTSYAVSDYVNHAKHNDGNCIIPLNGGDQR